MRAWREYLSGIILLLFLSIRYYPQSLERTLIESLRFLGAVILYGLGFAYLFKWALQQFLHRGLSRDQFLRIALWAGVIMALGESLRHYFYH
ncbi:MAG TPA: hypothetical protein ENJ40_00685 [Thermosulfurimonas dismutans]|uniref:Uncharacterized protein n=1 Tax=Thermosulfurimonas dismutans TaxID=999894 RepID=A0A7C3GJD3_9BACT|nr:hypothetical protein [Thermosulfurimonas dismutans]